MHWSRRRVLKLVLTMRFEPNPKLANTWVRRQRESLGRRRWAVNHLKKLVVLQVREMLAYVVPCIEKVQTAGGCATVDEVEYSTDLETTQAREGWGVEGTWRVGSFPSDGSSR